MAQARRGLYPLHIDIILVVLTRGDLSAIPLTLQCPSEETQAPPTMNDLCQPGQSKTKATPPTQSMNITHLTFQPQHLAFHRGPQIRTVQRSGRSKGRRPESIFGNQEQKPGCSYIKDSCDGAAMQRSCWVEILVLNREAVHQTAGRGGGSFGFQDFEVFEPGCCKEARAIFLVLRLLSVRGSMRSACASLMLQLDQTRGALSLSLSLYASRYLAGN